MANNVTFFSFNLGMGCHPLNERQSKNIIADAAKVPEFFGNAIAQLVGNNVAVISLQEVNNLTKTVDKIINILKKSTGADFYGEYYITVESTKNRENYGNAIITNCKINDMRKWNLTIEGMKEARGAVAININLSHLNCSSKEAWVICVHLAHGKEEKDRMHRIKQCEKINNYIQEKIPKSSDSLIPVIICGDFNVYDIAGSNANKGEYDSTIGHLISNGFSKIEIKETKAPNDEEGQTSKYTYPSNGKNSCGILDYILISNKDGALPKAEREFPTIENEGPAKYYTDHHGLKWELSFS